jgi:hypothetical protein
MIPALALAANGNLIKNAALIIGGVAVLGVGVYMLKKYSKDKDYQEAEKKLGDGSKEGVAVQLASRLYTAMKGWGTNEEAMFDVAKQISSYKAVNGLTFGDVASAFKKLYNDELLKWVNSELNSKDLAQFQKLLTA